MVSNILNEFDRISEYWAPIIVAEVNDSYVKIAKVKGDFVWHTHDDEDELFHVVKGSLTINYEGSAEVLKEGEMHVVKKGLRHFPQAEEECWIMLIEQKTTKHTGSTVSPLTKSLEEQMGNRK